MTKLAVVGVFERDLDLLLWEEIASSRWFRLRFLSKIGIRKPIVLQQIARSVNTSNGESDLEINFLCGRKRICVLLENKLDAPLQPDQSKRYRDRANSYVNKGQCELAKTVIVAPADYFSSTKDRRGFDYRITYEALVRKFENHCPRSARQRCKVVLLREAVKRKWVAIPDESATKFWHFYWERIMKTARHLQMEEPGGIPATSHFVRLNPPELGPGVSLIHKLVYGRVDLQFAGMGDRRKEIADRFKGYLKRDMQVAKAYKSAVVRITVPRIDMEADFLESIPAIDEGIRAASRLLALYVRHL